MVEHGRKHFVVDRDQARGLIGDVVRSRGNDGDRRANFEHFLAEHEAVRRTATDAHVLVDVRQVAAVEDSHDTRKCLRLAGVDGPDPRMRMRTQQRAHEEHAGLGHVLRVLAKAGDVAEAVQAWCRLADNRERALRNRA